MRRVGSNDPKRAKELFLLVRELPAAERAARLEQKAARWLELRAAVSWSRHLQRQTRDEEARASLARSFGWFSEGLDTVDLRAAKELLDSL